MRENQRKRGGEKKGKKREKKKGRRERGRNLEVSLLYAFSCIYTIQPDIRARKH